MDKHVPLEEALHTLDRATSGEKLHDLASIEGALSLVMSRRRRQARNQHHIIMKGQLLRSIDTIKIALLRLEAGHLRDTALGEKLLRVTERYNAILKKTKSSPRTWWQKLLHHAHKLHGGFFDEEFEEIEMPDLASRKISQVATHRSLEKITGVLRDTARPCCQEVDLFYAKAYTLLKHEGQPVLDEALRTLKTCSLEATLCRDDILSLRGAISPFPGETIELSGNFHRSGPWSVPIKESFTIRKTSSQSGYPHPLQHIGICFSEKLLPRSVLRPALARGVSQLVSQRRDLAKKLESGGALNRKAKELLLARKKLFRDEKTILLPLLEECLESFFFAAGVQAPPIREYIEGFGDSYFEALSSMCAKQVASTITRPIELCEQKWLSDTVTKLEDFETILSEALVTEKESGFPASFGAALAKCVPSVVPFLFSERLGQTPPHLDLFSQKMVAAAFQEQMDFISELEKIEEAQLLDWTISLIKKKTDLFRADSVTSPCIEELENYFIARSRG